MKVLCLVANLLLLKLINAETCANYHLNCSKAIEDYNAYESCRTCDDCHDTYRFVFAVIQRPLRGRAL